MPNPILITYASRAGSTAEVWTTVEHDARRLARGMGIDYRYSSHAPYLTGCEAFYHA